MRIGGSGGKWICCQLGAREHYAVPRALHQHGRLAGLYTDFWKSRKPKAESRNLLPRPLRSLAARSHPDLADARVESWNWGAVYQKLKAESGKRKSDEGPYQGFIEVGRQFATRVREALKKRNDLGANSIFFAYDTGALEALEWCKERGITCVLDQMDPNRVEVEAVREEENRWPGWALTPLQVPGEYFQRREREWELADRIVVNSEFCRQALVRQGVPQDKLVIIPLCYEPGTVDHGPRTIDQRPGTRDQGPGTGDHRPQTMVLSPESSFPSPRSSVLGPITVLFLGQVILRKGIQYLIEAARKLEGENIRFDIVGAVGISSDAVASAPRNVVFHGRVERDQASTWYGQSHVFVLPTISDGFAITQLEAMAHGLPVVTTPNCGEVVTDGWDGFIVPPRDPDALARVLQRYVNEPGLVQQQGRAAWEKSEQFTLARLAENLFALERDFETAKAERTEKHQAFPEPSLSPPRP